MSMTKTRKIKLDKTDWLELFVTKLGITYCVQFTNKGINIMEVQNNDMCKPLASTKLIIQQSKK